MSLIYLDCGTGPTLFDTDDQWVKFWTFKDSKDDLKDDAQCVLSHFCIDPEDTEVDETLDEAIENGEPFDDTNAVDPQGLKTLLKIFRLGKKPIPNSLKIKAMRLAFLDIGQGPNLIDIKDSIVKLMDFGASKNRKADAEFILSQLEIDIDRKGAGIWEVNGNKYVDTHEVDGVVLRKLLTIARELRGTIPVIDEKSVPRRKKKG